MSRVVVQGLLLLAINVASLYNSMCFCCLNSESALPSTSSEMHTKHCQMFFLKKKRRPVWCQLVISEPSRYSLVLMLEHQIVLLPILALNYQNTSYSKLQGCVHLKVTGAVFTSVRHYLSFFTSLSSFNYSVYAVVTFMINADRVPSEFVWFF